MKSMLKPSACKLLAGVLFDLSCKKEYSPGTNKSPIAIAGTDQTINYIGQGERRIFSRGF